MIPLSWYLIFSAALFCIGLFGIDALRSTGLDEEIAKAQAGTAMGVFFALANGLGRIGWGMISDKIGRKSSSLFTAIARQSQRMKLTCSSGRHQYLQMTQRSLVMQITDRTRIFL